MNSRIISNALVEVPQIAGWAVAAVNRTVRFLDIATMVFKTNGDRCSHQRAAQSLFLACSSCVRRSRIHHDGGARTERETEEGLPDSRPGEPLARSGTR